MRWTFLALILTLLASSALAADGDALSGGCAEEQGSRDCQAFLICENKTTAGTCSAANMFDLSDIATRGRGYPDYFRVTLNHATGCPDSGNDIQVLVRGADVDNTDEIDLHTGFLQLDGTRSRKFNMDFKFVDVVLSSETDFTSCTDIDVALVLFWVVR